MTPEFSIQAVKLEANPRTQRPIKYVPDKTTQAPLRSQSMNKRARQTSEIRKDDQNEPREQLSVPREQPKQYINMDERYLMYEQEAKKRENLVQLNPGVLFYKAVKPEQIPKIPLPKRNTKKIDKKELNQSKTLSQPVKEKSVSVKSNSKVFSEQFKDLYSTPNAAKQLDPEFLVKGEVDGYKLDESQSQMFSYGLNDYVSSNNHKKDLALKDVADDVKFKPQVVYSHFDYYPGDGTIPKPLLESVNYMNWLKQQEQEQQEKQQ